MRTSLTRSQIHRCCLEGNRFIPLIVSLIIKWTAEKDLDCILTVHAMLEDNLDEMKRTGLFTKIFIYTFLDF